MSNTAQVEPTEEQKQAANDYLDKHVHITISNTNFERVADVVARLLAEREARLREDLTKQCDPTVDMCGGCSACVHWYRERSIRRDRHNNTLRARVAELEADCGRLRADRYDAEMRCVGMEAREAQHLADIKALMAKRLVDMREAARWGAEISANVDDATDHEMAADIMEEFATFDAEDELMQRFAHYDDAKADAPAVCTHSTRVWNVIDQTMRCRVCDDAKAAEGGRIVDRLTKGET